MTGSTRSQVEAQPVIHLLELDSAQIEVQFAPGLDAARRDMALAWVQRSAWAVSRYFGRFPLPEVELLIVPVSGHGVLAGSSTAQPSPLVRIRLGESSLASHFESDWVLVHEMVHLAVPQVALKHQWLHEGLATYLEGLVRGRAGWLSAFAVWQAWTHAMPQGLPANGDAGLDHATRWGRTYWGGALFALLADVGLRSAGVPQRGLQQALQGVLQAGGDYRVTWPVERILATADAAVGQTTLTDLYRQMKDRAVPVDLASLWQQLGVTPTELRDDAPLAAVRRAILS